MKQIVTVTLNHICPMVTGITPHVGGPIIGPGCPGVLVNGTPVSLMGDACVCCGPPDMIAQGYPGIMVDGIPVVVQNCMTAHGGTIPMGVPGVTVGNATPIEPMTMHIKRIPFPRVRVIDKIGAAISGISKRLKQAADYQIDLRKKAFREELAIYNVHWEREEVFTDEGFMRHKITVVADTSGYEEGETITFTITPDDIDPDFGLQPDEKQVEGTVENGRVRAEWLVEI